MLIAPVVLLILSLSACSDDEPGRQASAGAAAAAEPSTEMAEQIRVVSGQAAQNGSVLTSIVEDFNGSGAGTRVDLELTDLTDAETIQRAMADVAAGSPPDLVRVTPSTLSALVSSDAARPVDVCLEGDHEPLRGDLDDAVLETMEVEGELFAMPWYSTVPALFYNADRFREAGLDPDSPPATYTELEEVARRLSDGESRFGVMLYGGNDYAFQGPLLSLGGAMVDGRGQPAFGGEAGVEVMESWRRLVEEQVMPFFANPFAEAAEAFGRGDVAMYVNSSANFPQVAARAPFEVRMAPMPVPDGAEEPVVPASTNGFALLTDEPDRVEAACAFLRHLVRPETVARTVRETATLPINKSAAAEELLASFMDEVPDLVEVNGQRAVPWFTFPGPDGPEFQRLFADAQTLILRGARSPADALRDLADRASSLTDS